jgi:cyclomaltodextrinase
MSHWAYDAVFYHIYPLGLCGAPQHNDFTSPAQPRLEQLHGWIDHLVSLGVNALYLGPVFESTTHGYDTADYYWVDRRLGTNETLAQLSAALHRKGIRLILDAVFNHVGRDFWAFRDVREHGERSAYRDWIHGLDFSRRSSYGDPFTYDGWNSHYSLVKLNLRHWAVKEHLFQAVAAWMRDFDVDGLRLDAADCMDMDFLKELAAFCKGQRPDFWLMGEITHGDYWRWTNPEMLDSVTNYECYKGLYSSHVDKNYFEIAYALNRQFGADGLYQAMPLYAFADNHDVNRVASNLKNPAHLGPLYTLLFTMPGVPSIYYGSEWGIEGKKTKWSDKALRPALTLDGMARSAPRPELVDVIRRLAAIRRRSPALRYGNYTQLRVDHEQMAFARQTADETVVVAVNAADRPAAFDLSLPGGRGSRLRDWLNGDECFAVQGGRVAVEAVPPGWARIMVVE